MDPCEAVGKELEKVLSKFESTNRNAQDSLQELLTFVDSVKRGIVEGTSDNGSGEELSAAQKILIAQCVSRVKEAVSKISSEHKDLHGCVSKIGKAIDKSFVNDFDGVILQKPYTAAAAAVSEQPQQLRGRDRSSSSAAMDTSESAAVREDERRRREIDEVICEHFLRHGMLDVAECLEKDCGRQLDEGKRDPFISIHRVHEALKAHDIQPALRWAEANSEQLTANQSTIEFRLHRLHFIELVQQGISAQWEAIEYAKNFARFADAHAKELQVLMGSLLYIKHGLQNSPYAHLLDPIDWQEICDIFIRDACALLGLATESPLSIVIKAGCTALPPLLTIKQVMQQRQCSGVWSAKDELPVEIELGVECRFHSVFACPILRQQCSDGNPPVRLTCGHVISKDALHKLSTVNKWAFLPNHSTPSQHTAQQHKVKCPYCPVEQSPTDAQQIYF